MYDISLPSALVGEIWKSRGLAAAASAEWNGWEDSLQSGGREGGEGPRVRAVFTGF